MRHIAENEFQSLEAVHALVAVICFGLFVVMVGLPFISGGGWLIDLIRLIGG